MKGRLNNRYKEEFPGLPLEKVLDVFVETELPEISQMLAIKNKESEITSTMKFSLIKEKFQEGIKKLVKTGSVLNEENVTAVIETSLLSTDTQITYYDKKQELNFDEIYGTSHDLTLEKLIFINFTKALEFSVHKILLAKKSFYIDSIEQEEFVENNTGHICVERLVDGSSKIYKKTIERLGSPKRKKVIFCGSTYPTAEEEKKRNIRKESERSEELDEDENTDNDPPIYIVNREKIAGEYTLLDRLFRLELQTYLINEDTYELSLISENRCSDQKLFEPGQRLFSKQEVLDLLCEKGENLSEYYVLDMEERLTIFIYYLRICGKYESQDQIYWNFYGESIPKEKRFDLCLDYAIKMRPTQLYVRLNHVNSVGQKQFFAALDKTIDNLPELSTIQFESCFFPLDLSVIQSLSKLKKIEIRYFYEAKIKAFSKCEKLEELVLVDSSFETLDLIDLPTDSVTIKCYNENDRRGVLLPSQIRVSSSMQVNIYYKNCIFLNSYPESQNNAITVNIDHDSCGIEEEKEHTFQRNKSGFDLHTFARDGTAAQIIKILLHSSISNFEPGDYRCEILTSTKIDDEDNIYFSSEDLDSSIEIKQPSDFQELNNFDEDTLNQIVLKNNNQPHYFGVEILSKNMNKWIPLASLNPLDELRYVKSASHKFFDIGYCCYRQQYFVRLKKEIEEAEFKAVDKIEFQYGSLYSKDNKKMRNLLKFEPLQSLPPVLHDALSKILDVKLWKNQKSDEKLIMRCIQKMQYFTEEIEKTKTYRWEKNFLIEQFCGEEKEGCILGFKDQKIDEGVKKYINELLNNLKIMNESVRLALTLMISASGVCRHRASVFHILGQFFSLRVRSRNSDNHRTIEAYEYRFEEGVGGYKILDLGGGTPGFIVTENRWEKKNDTQNISTDGKEEEKALANKQEEKKDLVNKKEEIKNRYDCYFKSEPIVLDETKGISSWVQALLGLKNPVIIGNKNAWVLHMSLYKELAKLNVPYFYIHEPSDIDYYFSTIELNPNGSNKIIPGPLHQFILKEGILLVNWKNFSENEIATYKSMLYKEATLEGVNLSKKISVIGYVDSNTMVSGESTSIVSWPKTLDCSCIPSLKPLENKKDERASWIDLYKSSEWKSRLQGQFYIDGDRLIYSKRGLFGLDGKVKSQIILSSVPQDKEFNSFISRLLIEKRFFLNSEWHQLPNDFSLFEDPTPVEKIVLQPIEKLKEIKTGLGEKIYYVNKQNVRYYLSNYKLDSEGKVNNKLPGLLANISVNDRVLVTDNLSESYLRELVDYFCETHPKHKKSDRLKFYTLSSQKTSSTMTDDIPIKTNLRNKVSSFSCVIMTNDYDSEAKKISDKQSVSHVVDISETMEYADLFESITPCQDANNTKTEESKTESTKESKIWGNRNIRLSKTTHCILSSLLKGETIILKGNISSELYHRIETLFCRNPYLIINGEFTEVKGKLILLTPKNNALKNLFQYAESYVELKDQETGLSDVVMLDEKKNSDTNATPKIKEALKKSPFVLLFGPPGTGKSHYLQKRLEELSETKEKYESFWGEENIINWLNSKPAGRKYLLLDEANMEKNGYWDFLKGLKNNIVYYKGKQYKTDDSFKVIFTGNPSNYFGRHKHDFLEKIPRVDFEAYSLEQLSEKFVSPLLNKVMPFQSQKSEREKIGMWVIQSYQYVLKIFEKQAIISIRDLKMLVQEICLSMSNTTTSELVVYKAVMHSFGGLFRSTKERDSFRQYLWKNIIKELNEPPQSKALVVDEYILTSKRRLLWNLLRSRWHMRDSEIDSGLLIERRGILVEGLPGMGKTEIMLAFLKGMKYKPYREGCVDSQRYLQITVGFDNVGELLKKAAALGIPVILDELNLLKEKDEKLLTDLLTAKPPFIKQGFFVFATQNAQSLLSKNSKDVYIRKRLSPAMLNRLDKFYEQPYDKDDLLEICKLKKMRDEDAKDFVDAYLRGNSLDPYTNNTRRFFERLQEVVGKNNSSLIKNSILSSQSVLGKHARDDEEEQRPSKKISM